MPSSAPSLSMRKAGGHKGLPLCSLSLSLHNNKDSDKEETSRIRWRATEFDGGQQDPVKDSASVADGASIVFPSLITREMPSRHEFPQFAIFVSLSPSLTLHSALLQIWC